MVGGNTPLDPFFPEKHIYQGSIGGRVYEGDPNSMWNFIKIPTFVDIISSLFNRNPE